MERNMAYEYANRAQAMDAAAVVGVDVMRVEYDPIADRFGWEDEQPSTALALIPGATVIDGTCTDETSSEESGSDDGVDNNEQPANEQDREAQPGDFYIRLKGAMLPGRAELELAMIATKLGRTCVTVDAFTGEVKGEAAPKAKRAKGEAKAESSRVRDERGLTEIQGRMLDLMLRPEGALASEMIDAGLATKANNFRYSQICITKASDGRFTMTDPAARMIKNDKGRFVAKSAWRMVEVPEADRKAALEAALAELAFKHQNGKKDEQANEQPAAEQANEQTAPEQANEQTAPEQANEQTAPEQANEQTAPEQANEQTAPEQTSAPANDEHRMAEAAD